MADSTVSVVLKSRDGQKQKINVKVENTLTSLIGGIQQVAQNISPLLNELVERERVVGDCSFEDEDSDEDDDEAEKHQNSGLPPSAKRSKM
ncbi:uncharacterized protein si:dkeyp-55f12.3 [Dunckerocampus dactyliophorus]|uniref:uncharacterized protein si:dkeyp-55f12.3 n=1 Tax=Dunckerocampus dactyliophorus TaxID=161453 RepID=UPI002406502A|nr:uncharacterized protein si:dkeyp-55f12.3 [Dunckerocampus dactyliophorus]